MLTKGESPFGKPCIVPVRQAVSPQLDHPDAGIQGFREAVQEAPLIGRVLTGHEEKIRQTQRGDNGTIGSGKCFRDHVPGMLPGHRLPLVPTGYALESGYPMHVEQDAPIPVVMANTDQGTGSLDADSQFLPQLPNQPLHTGLAGFQLPAGKFPQTALVDMVRTACHQHPPVIVFDGTSRNVDQVRYSALILT
jgi:hypothetical protein